MKLSHIVCALLACVPLTLEARTTASSEDGSSSAPLAASGAAGVRTAPGRDSSTKARHANDGQSTPQAGSGKGGGSQGRAAVVAVSPGRGSVAPLRGVGQLAHNNADRLQSLLRAKARGRIATTSHRPVGSNRAAIGGDALVRGARGSYPVGRPTLAVSNNAARAATSVKAVARESTIGGPRAPGPGRLGGPAIGRTAHNATIDGTQLHHKF